jgi:hypothetical protein
MKLSNTEECLKLYSNSIEHADQKAITREHLISRESPYVDKYPDYPDYPDDFTDDFTLRMGYYYAPYVPLQISKVHLITDVVV